MDFYDQKPTAWVAIGRDSNSHSGEKKEVDYRGHGNPNTTGIPTTTRLLWASPTSRL